MRQFGATLLELMIVLAISALLLGIGAPVFAEFATSMRLANASHEFLSSLHLARSEAIKRGQRTVVCASADGLACAGGGGWHQGWMLFHDANNNAARDAGEAVIQVRPALPAGVRLTGNQYVANYISYTPNGSTKLVGGAWQGGTLTVCKATAPAVKARQLVISSTGRVRTPVAASGGCPAGG